MILMSMMRMTSLVPPFSSLSQARSRQAMLPLWPSLACPLALVLQGSHQAATQVGLHYDLTLIMVSKVFLLNLN